jgi:penicillin amidase
MMSIQNDVLSLSARNVIPVVLPLLDTTAFDSVGFYCYQELQDWDFHYRADARAPTIAEFWWEDTRRMIWEDELANVDVAFPRGDVSEALLIEEPSSAYIDDRATPVPETIQEIVNRSFRHAVSRLVAELGPPSDRWQRGQVWPLMIEHMARLPGLGSPALAASGWWSTVNATGQRYGPSWRMVVELGDEIRAWGIYPGGQSGNPGSRFYDNAIEDWLAGEYYPLIMLRTSTESIPGESMKTTMRGVL